MDCVVDSKTVKYDHEAVQDFVSQEEKDLAESLRECCTIFGKEKESELSKTALILFEMGQLYMSKANRATGMLQKLTFLRSATLLNGAKVRFLLQDNQNGVSDVEKCLEILGYSMLGFASATQLDTNLLSVSKAFFEEVKKMRCYCKDLLFENAIVDYDSDCVADTGYEFDVKSRGISCNVKKMNEDITETFKNIMAGISDKSTKVMGTPPCKFAVVGLGSLARKEITPYSDFEHVIILDEGVQNRPDYHSIKEYFRWYAVCFQVIIINFGETFIRSVGVKSLNDLYAEDKKLNWFYDTYTPCGIAFDGMVPHSCNNPLGRIELTENKKFPLELIQPISEMAKLVEHESKRKNGYYVSEVLTRTCFVHGEKYIFNDFQLRVKNIIKFESLRTVADSQGELVQLNVLDSVKMWSPSISSYFNTKVTMYRPITVLISSIARSLKIEEITSFGIIQALLKLGVINEKFASDINAAFALTCNLRLKDYLAGGDQRYRGEFKLTLQSIGFKNLYAFYIIIEKIRLLAFCCFGMPHLRGHIPWGEHLSSLIYGFLRKRIVEAKVLYMFQRYDEAIDIAMDVLDTQFETLDDNNVIDLVKIVGSYLEKSSDLESKFSESDFRLCRKRIRKIMDMKNINMKCRFNLPLVAAEVCLKFDHEEDAIMFCNEGIHMLDTWNNEPIFNGIKLRTKQFLEHEIVLALLKQGRYATVSQICRQFFDSEYSVDMDLRWRYVTSWIKAEFGMIQTESAKRALNNLYVQIKKSPGFASETTAISALYRILEVQYDHAMHGDFCKTHELLDSLIRESDVRAEQTYQRYLLRMGKKITKVYLLLKKYELCITAAQSNIASIKRISDSRFRKMKPNASVYHHLATAHHFLSLNNGTDGEKINHMRSAVEAFSSSLPLPDDAIIHFQEVLSNFTNTLCISYRYNPNCAWLHELCMAISTSPTRVKRSKNVQEAAARLISVITRRFKGNAISKNHEELCDLFFKLPSLLSFEITHPLTYLNIMQVCRNNTSASSASVFEKCFFDRYKLNFNVYIYNRAVSYYAKYDLKNCADELWKSLQKEKAKIVLGNSVRHLFSLISFNTGSGLLK